MRHAVVSQHGMRLKVTLMRGRAISLIESFLERLLEAIHYFQGLPRHQREFFSASSISAATALS
jgi:ribosomal protein L5